jgi:hypothetical protein
MCVACADAPLPDDTALDPTAGWVVGDGPDVAVTGAAFRFGPSGGLDLRGAAVFVAEDPTLRTTLTDDGTFALSVPSGAPLSFVLEQPGFWLNQTATLDVGPDGVDQVGFQAPTLEMGTLLGLAADVEIDDDRCQVATTVSALSSPPYGGAGVGEPGAVVSIEPPLPDGAVGPVYFDYVSDEVILPDPSLTETTIDGGVIFANLPAGAYRLTAAKAGVTFSEVEIRCRPGLLVNAAPPHGIQTVP